MTYIDTSVILAQVLLEDSRPPESLWGGDLVSSRLLLYETCNRLQRDPALEERLADARLLLERVRLVELAPPVLARALEPFPAPVRTLDALHLSTVVYLAGQGTAPRLATYDDRLGRAAKALGIRLARL